MDALEEARRIAGLAAELVQSELDKLNIAAEDWDYLATVRVHHKVATTGSMTHEFQRELAVELFSALPEEIRAEAVGSEASGEQN